MEINLLKVETKISIVPLFHFVWLVTYTHALLLCRNYMPVSFAVNVDTWLVCVRSRFVFSATGLVTVCVNVQTGNGDLSGVRVVVFLVTRSWFVTQTWRRFCIHYSNLRKVPCHSLPMQTVGLLMLSCRFVWQLAMSWEVYGIYCPDKFPVSHLNWFLSANRNYANLATDFW